MRSENSSNNTRKPDGVPAKQIRARWSIVLVAQDKGLQAYPSIQSVPQPLRNKIESTVRGENATTLLIADQLGRAELVRALQSRSAPPPPAPVLQPETKTVPQRKVPFSWRTWAELLIPIGVGASLWLLLSLRM